MADTPKGPPMTGGRLAGFGVGIAVLGIGAAIALHYFGREVSDNMRALLIIAIVGGLLVAAFGDKKPTATPPAGGGGH